MLQDFISSWNVQDRNCELPLAQVSLLPNEIESVPQRVTKFFTLSVKNYDEARLLLFAKCHLEKLPPTSDALEQYRYIKICHYQRTIGIYAYRRVVDLPKPEELGAQWTKH